MFFFEIFFPPQTSDSPVGARWAIHPAAPALPLGVAGPGGRGAHPAAEPCPAVGPLKTAVTGHSVHGSEQHSDGGLFPKAQEVAGSRRQAESHRVGGSLTLQAAAHPPTLIPLACGHHSETSVKRCSSLPVRPGSPMSSMSPCMT